MSGDRAVPPQQGDEHELFVRYDSLLQARVTRAVQASREAVEDGCAFAWSQLLIYQPRRETVLAWLTTVACNETVRLASRERQGHAFEQLEVERLPDARDGLRGRDALLDARSRLEAVPERRRRVLVMRGMGWSLKEIAAELNVTTTRATQIAQSAKADLRHHDRAADMEDIPMSNRQLLLQQLQREPPHFIKAAIGRYPHASQKTGGYDRQLRWSRLAMRIVDYRAAHGVDDPVRALGGPPSAADRSRTDLESEIGSFMLGRRRANGRER